MAGRKVRLSFSMLIPSQNLSLVIYVTIKLGIFQDIASAAEVAAMRLFVTVLRNRRRNRWPSFKPRP